MESIELELLKRREVATLLADGKKWKAFKTLYDHQNDEIMSRAGNSYSVDPYVVDWASIFTPIEMDAWQTIRGIGVPLYPQYPVGGVFVDFGDPVKKIALECDGKGFHDRDRDIARDSMLFSLGWTVFRATGSECRRREIDLEALVSDLHDESISQTDFDAAIDKWAHNSSDGLIHAIAWKFYGIGSYPVLEQRYPLVLHSHSFFYGA